MEQRSIFTPAGDSLNEWMDAMVNTKKRKLNLSEMEVIAKDATRAALVRYAPPTAEEGKILTLGSGIMDTEGIFELYIATDRPQDAKVISCAKVNRLTGEVTVEVFLPPL